MLQRGAWLVSLAVMTLTLSLLQAEDKPDAQPAASSADSALRVSAKDLYTEYKASEKKANAKYKDKTLEVSGPVRHIDKSEADRVFIELGTGFGDENIVKCFFGRAGSKVKDFKGGQQVVIRGLCQGMKGPHVNLSGCEMVTE
jgi:hypothetical protein